VVNNRWFENGITLLIILNAITLCIQTYQADILTLQNQYSVPIIKWLDIFDWIVVLVFSVDVVLRLILMRQKFWYDGWNIFDVVILAASLIGQSPIYSALRVLRTLRVLRLLYRHKTLRLISSVMWNSVKGCVWISFLMIMVLMIFAIIGHDLYGATNPKLFGNLHLAMHTLFRVAALYTYDDVVTQLVDEHPYVYLYIIPYFIIMSYIVINFFSGIVVYYLYEISYEELKTGEKNTTEIEEESTNSQVNSELLQELISELKQLKHAVTDIKGRGNDSP
jgi:voltage-gated sodium channel